MRDLSEATLAFCGSTLCCPSYILVSGSSRAVAFKFACHAEDEDESQMAKSAAELGTPFDTTIHVCV